MRWCTQAIRGRINDKGLVSYDRQTRKDAFHFYKANWNPAPMVYLTSRRFTQRQSNVTTIRAYSNCDTVKLFVNGQSFGSKTPEEFKVVSWGSVALQPDANKVELRGSRKGIGGSDFVTWTNRSGKTTGLILIPALLPK